ncbi:MAG: tetratricopeptide repeat protein, partial [Acidobacteriota bacterium]|nr:tetratricopeptide repeat protein [Acidobacteriota bacterium]
WRGNNRLAGYIIDKTTGKPIAGAKLKLRSTKGSQGGPDIAADTNGKWAVLGLGAGGWNIDIEAPGYDLRQVSTGLNEGQRLPPMKIEMEPVAAPQPVAAAAEPAHEEVKIGGVAVSKDIADAVETGNKLLNEQKYKEAITEYEKAYPTLSANLSLKFALARAYYGSGQVKKAIVLLDEAYKAEPTNTQAAVLLANMLLEDGQLEKGKQLIDSLPPTSLNLDSLLNTGIALMNKKQPNAATEYFSRAITLDANRYEGYYYRGLAAIQMGKAKQAKPDLEKVIALAPDSSEAKDAREYLKSIK